MPLQLKDLVKLTRIIERIQAGHFDANDVDNLLMKLRAYAGEKTVFLEVAHFVAHSDARDRGLAQQSGTMSSEPPLADDLPVMPGLSTAASAALAPSASKIRPLPVLFPSEHYRHSILSVNCGVMR